jgi:hypothetical protein
MITISIDVGLYKGSKLTNYGIDYIKEKFLKVVKFCVDKKLQKVLVGLQLQCVFLFKKEDITIRSYDIAKVDVLLLEFTNAEDDIIEIYIVDSEATVLSIPQNKSNTFFTRLSKQYSNYTRLGDMSSQDFDVKLRPSNVPYIKGTFFVERTVNKGDI